MDFDNPKVYSDTFISDGLVIIGIVIITIISDDVYGNCDMCQTCDPGIEYQPARPTPQEIPIENIKTLHSLYHPWRKVKKLMQKKNINQ